ncbi:hypothetical protein GCM10023191_074090 [Actinoallomurus oryzae]|uniref:DarT domain-containing protein n=1 Tax=Actinoallomurus oryzae TaxID=502180 RepID=A0ABP8QTB6_9ACTN
MSRSEILAYAHELGITEILHFTTNKGLVGIFASGGILSRDRLEEDKYIEHIYTPNCEDRLKDADWTDYVNLSISRINGRMLGVSGNWHNTEDVWWVILSLDVSVLDAPGVYFTTTNNTYSNCVIRGTGVDGLKALFAGAVEWGWYGSKISRYPSMPDEYTTDPQAEVLYPGKVPISALRKIYVKEGEHQDAVYGMLSPFPSVPRVPVLNAPEVFR